MDKYIERVETLKEHLKDHPTDYQAVVALLKRQSELIEHRAWLQAVERKKRVALIRKARKEKANAKK